MKIPNKDHINDFDFYRKVNKLSFFLNKYEYSISDIGYEYHIKKCEDRVENNYINNIWEKTTQVDPDEYTNFD